MQALGGDWSGGAVGRGRVVQGLIGALLLPCRRGCRVERSKWAGLCLAYQELYSLEGSRTLVGFFYLYY